MDCINKNRRIAYLISKKRMELLDDAEQQELQDWIEASPQNRDLFCRLMEKDFVGDFNLYRKLNPAQAWSRYKRHKKGLSRYLMAWSSAAVVAVFLCAGLYLWYGNSGFGHEHDQLNTIASGSSKAVLTLSDGSLKNLGTSEQIFHVDETSVVQNMNSAISYHVSDSCKNEDAEFELKYNALSIPEDSEYKLVLSDGTMVWLNSKTDIRFPIQFGRNERVVYLKGEAYFEVARDTARPFYVELENEVGIKVLGTSFNVRAYDADHVEAVLEKGSVEIRKDDICRRMVPGTLAVYSGEKNEITLEKVDTELYTSWRLGQYIFKNQRLDTILAKLSEWYKMQVVFLDPEAKIVVYSGSIRKYDSIDNWLEALEATGWVRFKIDGSTLYVEISK